MVDHSDTRQALHMGILKYQWASDADFDGMRLEALSDEGDVLFDVSISDDRHLSINTFGKQISANLIEAALEIARSFRTR